MRKLILCLLAVPFLCHCDIGSCQALFATLHPAVSSSNPEAVVRFDNTTGTFGTDSETLDVEFQFLTPAPLIGTNRIPARLTFRARQGGFFGQGCQPLGDFEFTVRAINPKHIYRNGILLRSVPIEKDVLALADLFQVGDYGSLTSDFALGLVMESDYLPIEPYTSQSCNWTFLEPLEGGYLVAGENGWLRDTRLGRQLQGSFVGKLRVSQKPSERK